MSAYDAALWIDPARMGGSVCVMGTRIDTETIAGIAWHHGVDEVRGSFEDLTDYQIACALWWEWQYLPIGRRPKWAMRVRGLRKRDAKALLADAPRIKP